MTMTWQDIKNWWYGDDFLDGLIRHIYRIVRLSQKLELNSEQCKEEILGNIRETRDLIPSFPELIVVLVDDLYRKPDLTEKEFMKAMKNVNNSKTARQETDHAAEVAGDECSV